MFYDGDLQSGIALALRDSKFLACFIKGDDDQTSLWESEYLQDHQVKRALDSKAVTLCIKAGSPEAGFLEAYYPIPVIPAFIVINNGQLTLDLRSGEAKDSFKAAVLKTLVSWPPNTIQPSSSPPAPTSATESTVLESSSREDQLRNTEPPANVLDTSATSDQTTRSSRTTIPTNTASGSVSNASGSTTLGSDTRNSQTSQTVQNLLADRRRRLEVDKKEKEAVEKAERKAKAEARKASTTTDPDSSKAKQATYAQQQRQRQQDARLERERVLLQIQQDKAERKEKEEARKAARAHSDANDGAGGLVDQQLTNEMCRSKLSNAKECAIQVRLFDGGTIRSRFRSDSTLRTEVRKWVDGVRPDGDFPYTFKRILAPLPNRTLSISDEEDSLRSLGLAPSATLVMVPIQGYTGAYTGAYDGNQSFLSKGVAIGYNVVSAGAGLVTGALSTVLGLGQATAQEQGPSNQDDTSPAVPESSSRGSTSGINIRTLRDQQENRDEHQFYNGNQLNFEPRSEPEDREID